MAPKLTGTARSHSSESANTRRCSKRSPTLLSVGEAEAAALVRTELKGIHTLDGFMRVAGVVKDRVSLR
ncbi:hypothetical protein MTO96_050622 [Rhipicephalus appendiculatus]